MVRHEPMDMRFLEENPTFTQAFSNVGCLRFCQKLQGYHGKISKEFSINFIGTGSKVGVLIFSVSLDTISQATKIPNSGELWFKV